MSEAHKVLIRRFLEEIWHKGNLDAVEEFIAPYHVRHTSHSGVGEGRDLHGPEEVRHTVAAIRSAFPDIHFTEEDMLVDGDKVVLRWTSQRTHLGLFRGIAPTGKRVSVTGINIYRIADGKIVERWAQEDGVWLLQQLGAIPPLE